MRNKMKLISNIIEIIIGISLCICYFAKLIDEFWSGMGVALIVVGFLQLLRSIKYYTNESYREKTDIEVNDERNKYISLKAWSWAGYLFVIIAAIATIVFKLLDKEPLMMLASGSVCIIITLYWVSYMILNKNN